MFEENSLDLIRKFWPNNAPDINNVPKYINKYKNEVEKIFAQVPSSWDHLGIP